jgi:DNA-binding NtrC family response regulator
VIAFSSDAGGSRVGEVFLVVGRAAVLGRGPAHADDAAPRLLPCRQKPGENEARPPLDSPFLSRVQLEITRWGDELLIGNVGRCALRDEQGRDVGTLRVTAGDCFALGHQLLLLVVERPLRLPPARHLESARPPPFGEADASGVVGESEAAWRLRDALSFLGGRSAHALVTGASGTGKEVAAQAIHALSARRGRKMVARNAATIPATLVEAELFGNAAHYPNAGMQERAGLVGEADGATLFLDEIGELADEVQTKLLRLLDAGGEYQRLGDARRRSADLRFIGATNRPVEALRQDLAARLKLRLTLPGLEARREDIPLLALHLLRQIAAEDTLIRTRFFDAHGPRLTLPLMRFLVLHRYTTHVRELEGLLWTSISESSGDHLELTPGIEATATAAGGERAEAMPVVTHEDVGPDAIRAALARAGGVRERAWRDLGLANRHVLKRLIKKHGIADE